MTEHARNRVLEESFRSHLYSKTHLPTLKRYLLHGLVHSRGEATLNIPIIKEEVIERKAN
jgi:hypothetical protein